MPPRHRPTAIVPARASRWNQDAARSFLDDARHKMASGTGMSDRSLERMAILAEPGASLSRTTFRHALRRVGWTERRIERAIQSVQPPRARLSIQITPQAHATSVQVTKTIVFVGAVLAVVFVHGAIGLFAAGVVGYYVGRLHTRRHHVE